MFGSIHEPFSSTLKRISENSPVNLVKYKYDDSLRMCERKVNSTPFSCIHFILFTNWHILTVSLKLLDRVCIRKYSKRKFNNLQVLNIQFELEVKVQYHWKSRNFMKELHNSPFNFLFKKYEHFCSIISTTK